MLLHQDKEAFRVIIEKLSRENNIRVDILEKDYYVTLLLNELSQKDNQNYAFFKGGTSLYKALKSIKRFSEDIDLTIYVKDCSNNSQIKKRIENSVLYFKSLKISNNTIKNKGSIECEYLYESLFSIDEEDELQRFGKVKVEATSFTVSEPSKSLLIEPFIYTLASPEEQSIMKEKYEIEPFYIETITIERIFIDKIFAAEFYFIRNKYRDAAKHIYDLVILFSTNTIKDFLKDKSFVLKMIQFKREEEKNRKGGIPSSTKIEQFNFFNGIINNHKFFHSFDKMLDIYVFNKNDYIYLDKIIKTIKEIEKCFINL